ncbi:unnamed protein product [Lepeophtheirus salmonis]|uniref:(salmon louse) hypothetical protein n=1 Tax=Lepeophtheirus salmonis TaxID=72036 RepID=A0A7R8CF71_LEPSM|nr:unnamed protein product [Lepeophtheirus salmonis]CAF2803371.1 unnamed protein product [Lepeophtheirus salmonis]
MEDIFWDTLNYEGSSSYQNETRYSDMPYSLHDELRELREEVKQLRSQTVPLDKERSYFNMYLSTQEENISLKAKVKDLEENGRESSSSSSTDLLNQLRNENSSLKHQLEYLKLKNESDGTTISKLKSTILALKTKSSIESKVCEKIAKPVKDKEKKSLPITIMNQRLKPSSKDTKRSVRLTISETIVNCKAILDEDANISICGPDMIKYFKSISPSLLNPYTFANRSSLKCLGTIKVTLSNPEKEDNTIETTLYIFKRVKILILCRNDWIKLKYDN